MPKPRPRHTQEPETDAARVGVRLHGVERTATVSVRDEVGAWSDARLVQAVAVDSPDEAALDVLVARHWKVLYGRCRLLTLDAEAASDLAQETWARVLHARRSLQPSLNFAGYLVTIARNLWFDQHRASKRAGAMATERLARLDDQAMSPSGDVVRLADAVPDAASLVHEDQTILRMDVDRALSRLSPLARDVIIARFLDGESAAEIGRRHGRTEQTITSWLRAAIAELRQYFGDPDRGSPLETLDAR